MKARSPIIALAGTLLLGGVLLASGCAADKTSQRSVAGHSPSVTDSATSASPAASADTSGSAGPCPSVPGGEGWDCAQRQRFATATGYLARRPGTIGVVVRDRVSGATWRAGNPTSATWTASTIKLGIAAALLEWHRAGRIALTGTDRSQLHLALVNSDNDAATALWNRYDPKGMFERFRGTYGMSTLAVVDGYNLFWRNLRCSAEDLHHLVSYVLDTLHPDDRRYLLGELRAVNSAQRWGVWAAGAAMRPGNKNGWAQKPDPGGTHWVTHTVGFAGPDERYSVVITYRLLPSGTLADGVHAVSDLVATIFGAPVPAKVTVP